MPTMRENELRSRVVSTVQVFWWLAAAILMISGMVTIPLLRLPPSVWCFPFLYGAGCYFFCVGSLALLRNRIDELERRLAELDGAPRHNSEREPPDNFR